VLAWCFEIKQEVFFSISSSKEVNQGQLSLNKSKIGKINMNVMDQWTDGLNTLIDAN